MSGPVTPRDESSAVVSAVAFKAVPRLAFAVGAVQSYVALEQKLKGTERRVARGLKDVSAMGEKFISAWQDYLNVPSLHSEPCLKAALTTVSEAAELFGTLRETGEEEGLWSPEWQARLRSISEAVKDIQENLALLLDEKALGELRDVLAEAGISTRALVREDGETR